MSLRTTDFLAAALLLTVACVDNPGGGDGGAGDEYGLCPAPVSASTDAGLGDDGGSPDVLPADAGSPVPEGVTCDPATGLFWQTTPSSLAVTQDEARIHCEDLTLAGITSWRLPTITELRTLVANCEATRTGGDCKVSDPDCLTPSICFDLTCAGCGAGEGPGAGGCYLDPRLVPALEGECSAYWTTSLQDGLGSASFFWLDFWDAKIDRVSDVQGALARCVHQP
ncbi:MAG: DUF1566 domain-containing protein [Deltaproteobacteria bacterium]|nr:DUF1566 domain-containing protein [Deltaproteobacteria bacterium]